MTQHGTIGTRLHRHLFETERRYPEAEVNAVINQVHEDHATLRRLLVDYRLMERAGGVYWRV